MANGGHCVGGPFAGQWRAVEGDVLVLQEVPVRSMFSAEVADHRTDQRYHWVPVGASGFWVHETIRQREQYMAVLLNTYVREHPA